MSPRPSRRSARSAIRSPPRRARRPDPAGPEPARQRKLDATLRCPSPPPATHAGSPPAARTTMMPNGHEYEVVEFDKFRSILDVWRTLAGQSSRRACAAPTNIAIFEVHSDRDTAIGLPALRDSPEMTPPDP